MKDRPGNSTGHRSSPNSLPNVTAANALQRSSSQSRTHDLYSNDNNADILDHSSNDNDRRSRAMPKSKAVEDTDTPKSRESVGAKKKPPYRPANEHPVSEEHGSSPVMRQSKGSALGFNNSRVESGNTASVTVDPNYGRFDSCYETEYRQPSLPPSFPSSTLGSRPQKSAAAAFDVISVFQDMGPPRSTCPDATGRERKWHDGNKGIFISTTENVRYSLPLFT